MPANGRRDLIRRLKVNPASFWYCEDKLDLLTQSRTLLADLTWNLEQNLWETGSSLDIQHVSHSLWNPVIYYCSIEQIQGGGSP